MFLSVMTDWKMKQMKKSDAKASDFQTVDQKALTLKQMPRCECFSVKTEEDFEK